MIVQCFCGMEGLVKMWCEAETLRRCLIIGCMVANEWILMRRSKCRLTVERNVHRFSDESNYNNALGNC